MAGGLIYWYKTKINYFWLIVPPCCFLRAMSPWAAVSSRGLHATFQLSLLKALLSDTFINLFRLILLGKLLPYVL